ncbi:MAG: transaldolase, partial [bacterium]
LLLGMGGSSLAPDLFRKTFGTREGYLDLRVLDSTDPEAVSVQDDRLDLARTLFIVSTKSGTTVETLSFFKHFYNRTVKALGRKETGSRFIAITDPGSPLERAAAELGFRETFLNDPDIGGRYSALSYFGLVPAALLGVDIERLLERAATKAANCEPVNCPVEGDNTGAILGAFLGTLHNEGVDKMTLVTSPQINALGAWLEQLMAESTGKEGKGILPVDGEIAGPPEVYGRDRLFVYLRTADDHTHDFHLDALEAAGFPAVRIVLADLYDLGGEFLRWEMATAVAGHILGINPFDQPDVESAKVQARNLLARYRQAGALPPSHASFSQEGIEATTGLAAGNLRDAMTGFLSLARAGDYVCIQAYIHPTPESALALGEMRHRIRDRYKLATTLGFGPRFLHSTGQLHKGDAGRGLFIQVTSGDSTDIPIPDEPGKDDSTLGFGVLKAAQALGDRQALLDAGRRVIRFHLTGNQVEGLRLLGEIAGG